MTQPIARRDADPMTSFRQAIHRMTGISLPATKTALIEQRLRRRVVHHGLPCTGTYLDRVLSGSLGQAEIDTVVDLITTNTTSFFRERAHFDHISAEILPAILADRRRKPRLKCWSAASSEGAEAYSLAMVLAEQQRAGHAFDWAILGTDLSVPIIEKARRAVYSTEQVAPVDPILRRRYLMTSDDPALRDQVRIVPELRRRVLFRQMNLMDARYPVDRDVDIIFLRNVLIYFDLQDRQDVVRRLQGHLRPGGWLIVGHSEGMSVTLSGLERVRPTIFRKL
ncbi:CheR family methyltransferase [Paracoccus sp. NSM]|uniref:CheR family methyltransferase n=1 Tax=Paracoccus sp. NSM TaxID=3457784 RepID=UPI004036FE08